MGWGWGRFVVVIPPHFPSPHHRSDREFTGVSWWSATRERQWEYWWGRGYKMPHDSIQILLVVKPSQKDREFGNCRDNHCSKRRSICTVCSWKFRPPVIQCFNKQRAVDKNKLNIKHVSLGGTWSGKLLEFCYHFWNQTLVAEKVERRIL